jgi:hypothetical protein
MPLLGTSVPSARVIPTKVMIGSGGTVAVGVRVTVGVGVTVAVALAV